MLMMLPLISMILVGCGTAANSSSNNSSIDNPSSQEPVTPSSSKSVTPMSFESRGNPNYNPTPSLPDLPSVNPVGPVESPWSEADQEVINTYLFGIQLPYIEIPEDEGLVYDEEYETVYRTGGDVDANLIDEYAAMFEEAGWEVTFYDPEETGYYYYYLYAELPTMQGLRHMNGYLFADDGEGNPSETGEGTFHLELYDPYYYSFPSELFDIFVQYYLGAETPVPAAAGCDYYVLDTEYLDYGALIISCFTTNDMLAYIYEDYVESCGFFYRGVDSYGYDLFVDPTFTYEVQVLAFPGEGFMIYVMPTDMQVPEAISMPATLNIQVGKTKALGAKLVDTDGYAISKAPIEYTIVERTTLGIKVDANGNVTVSQNAQVGDTATIRASYHDAMGFNVTADCVVTVAEAIPNYKKVTSKDQMVSGGKYLIVYEGSKYAFNSKLSSVDAANNYLKYEVENNEIVSDDALAAAAVTITFNEAKTQFQIRCANGKYITAANNANTLKTGTSAANFTVNFLSNGDFDLIETGGAHFRYNASSGQYRFRFYKSSTYTNQKAIQLYYVGA